VSLVSSCNINQCWEGSMRYNECDIICRPSDDGELNVRPIALHHSIQYSWIGPTSIQQDCLCNFRLLILTERDNATKQSKKNSLSVSILRSVVWSRNDNLQRMCVLGPQKILYMSRRLTHIPTHRNISIVQILHYLRLEQYWTLAYQSVQSVQWRLWNMGYQVSKSWQTSLSSMWRVN